VLVAEAGALSAATRKMRPVFGSIDIVRAPGFVSTVSADYESICRQFLDD
jgi:hypothetical protein